MSLIQGYIGYTPKHRKKRMKNKGKIKGLAMAGAAVVLLALTGCAVSTPIDQAAVIYKDGMGDKKFEKCVPAGKRVDVGANIKEFRYPVNSRDFQFATDDVQGKERGPIEVLAQGGIKMSVSGAVYFTLNDKCDILRQFHEQVGTTMGATNDETGEGTSALSADEWNKMLAKYIGVPVENALDRVSLDFTVEELTSDPKKKNEWQAAAQRQIVDSITQVTGGASYFCKPGYKGDGKDECGQFSISLNQAQPPAAISEAKADAAAAATRINNQKSQAQSQAELIKQFGVEGYLELQRQQFWRDALNKGGVTFIPVPQGSTLNIPAPTK